jgi:hypothetical protein
MYLSLLLFRKTVKAVYEALFARVAQEMLYRENWASRFSAIPQVRWVA